MPWVTGIADDVYWPRETEINHNIAVLSLLKTAQSNNLKFNATKVLSKMRECKFFGQLLMPEEMNINPKKVDAIRQMEASK